MPKNSAPEPVEQQRLRLLFKQAHTASTVAAVSAVACTLFFVQAQMGVGAPIWLGAVLLATALRMRLFRQFFSTDIRHQPESHWLRSHAVTAVLVGLAWGSVPLVPVPGPEAHNHLRQLQTILPGFVLMAAITSYGVYFSQYLALWTSTTTATVVSRLYISGTEGLAEATLFSLFAPLLLFTAKRYSDSLLASATARNRSDQLVRELTATNNELHRHNAILAQQQDLIEQEEALARHVFRQLTLGGDHKLPGVHTWNQSMGSLSGDLTQTVSSPDGRCYVFLGDFTGHGLPAALGALPASSVFLAMAAKGLPLDSIAAELNEKLRQLLPVGYFCCAVLLELAADRRSVKVWNGGLPPVLIRRNGESGYKRIASHSLPLGVVDEREFDSSVQVCAFRPGDLLYAYTDGLTEAENIDGERWGTERLEQFLTRPELAAPRLPALIEAVLEHVNLAPASDDVSVVEIEATPATGRRADAA